MHHQSYLNFSFLLLLLLLVKFILCHIECVLTLIYTNSSLTPTGRNTASLLIVADFEAIVQIKTHIQAHTHFHEAFQYRLRNKFIQFWLHMENIIFVLHIFRSLLLRVTRFGE